MKNKTLWRTNLLVCAIIIVGFLATSIISYRSNVGIYEKDVEKVSTLTSDGMYNDIAAIFSQPVSVSLAMANDNLLKSFLSVEKEKINDNFYILEMQNYLNGYRDKYGYDSVFLVSAATQRYYHFDGLDRILEKSDSENVWYYDFLKSDEEYSLNVDNDQTTKENIITVFVNCKIKDKAGNTLGVVGVGLKVDSLKTLIREYESKYGIHVYLVNNEGVIEISSDKTGYENVNLFTSSQYEKREDCILTNKNTKYSFWYAADKTNVFVVTRYEPNLKWHLIVENDTGAINKELTLQLLRNASIVLGIMALVMYTITTVIKKYNTQIIKLTISQELEYQRLLHETTEEMYEGIFEIDITHNCTGGDNTKEYAKIIGIKENTPFDQALQFIASEKVKPEYAKGYLDLFMPENIIKNYNNGINNLSYDFMISDDKENYHWVRTTARIFFWNSDKSIRMISYRKNIDAERKHELLLVEELQRDSMTGLYNKLATENLIAQCLIEDKEKDTTNIFLLFDIDNFKNVNDTKGHSFGDHVIHELATEIKTQFKEYDILGRIGGDEFVVLMRNTGDLQSTKSKLERICTRLTFKDVGENTHFHISCSIGVSIYKKDGTTYTELYEKADQALYYAKGHGKASFSIYGESYGKYQFGINQRDMQMIMNVATDGIAKFACTTPFTILYFNEKYMEFTGLSAQELSQPEFDALNYIHPDDTDKVMSAFTAAKEQKGRFSVKLRMCANNDSYFNVHLQGIFTNEVYENIYPVFYAIYTKLPNQEI